MLFWQVGFGGRTLSTTVSLSFLTHLWRNAMMLLWQSKWRRAGSWEHIMLLLAVCLNWRLYIRWWSQHIAHAAVLCPLVGCRWRQPSSILANRRLWRSSPNFVRHHLTDQYFHRRPFHHPLLVQKGIPQGKLSKPYEVIQTVLPMYIYIYLHIIPTM